MKMMELLLLENVPKLGKKGNTVRVKLGYGRNYLIPKKLATPVTKESLRFLEIEEKRLRQLELEKQEEFKKLAQEMELTACTIEAKANEDGNLFGSVSYAMIAEGFQEMGFEVQADDITLEDESLYPIKELGIFTIQVKLHSEVTAKSKVWVVNEQEGSE